MVVCGLSGCEDAPADVSDLAAVSVVDLAEPDLDRRDADGARDGGAPDLSDPPPVHGTRCGGAVCFGEATQYCHTSDWGASGLCVTRPVASPGYYGCDGPEDCAAGACCYLDSASACSSFGFCVAGAVVGEFMCHTDAECGGGSRCCSKGSTGSYRTCVDGLGPTEPCPTPTQ